MMNLLLQQKYFNQVTSVPLFSKYKNLGKDIAEEFYKNAKHKTCKIKTHPKKTYVKTTK